MIPDTFPDVLADYDGPCMIEVFPEHRSGRGRFWRPNGAGYTDDPGQAGLYPTADVTSGRGHAVAAMDVLAALREDIEARRAQSLALVAKITAYLERDRDR